MSACVAAAGAAQAGDLCQDFKTGKLMKTPVLSQVMAQFSGVPIGVVASVLVYKLFDMAYTIGDPSGAAPAPSANSWMAVAKLLDDGLGSLPPHVGWAMLAAAFVGVILPIINRKYGESRFGMWIPSGSSFGIAFIVEPSQSVVMFLGAMLILAWKIRNEASCEMLASSIASGLVVGAGLMGIVSAVLSLFEVPTLVDPDLGY
eukprot:m.375606 g.375606  ORF g.375606 m.375606 type:complete len:203 (-) comp56181_c0_seq5:59-667(-)